MGKSPLHQYKPSFSNYGGISAEMGWRLAGGGGGGSGEVACPYLSVDLLNQRDITGSSAVLVADCSSLRKKKTIPDQMTQLPRG